MKACFIGGARYPQPLNTTSLKKFRLLKRLGETFVIGFSQDLRPRRFTEYAHFYLLPQFPLPVFRYVTMLIFGPLLSLWLIHRYGVQVLIAQSPYEGFVAALAKGIAARLGREVALVVESHGDFENSLFLYRRVRPRWFFRTLMAYAAKFSLRYADALRAISAATCAQLQRWAPDKPVIRFPTWTDIEVFLKAGTNAPDKRKNLIVYAGVLIPLKGVHFLIEAFAQVRDVFPDACLWLIGRVGNAEYVNSLKAQVQQLGLSEQVMFYGHLPQQKLAQCIAQAQALVLPSLSEGLGRVVIEAMACGTPVIGSRVGGIQEVIQDGKTGFLVPPGDVEALAERIRWIFTHPDESGEMGRQAREFAQAFFSPDAYLQSYARLLHLAVSRLKARSNYALADVQPGNRCR